MPKTKETMMGALSKGLSRRVRGTSMIGESSDRDEGEKEKGGEE
jgi:hypothetical protein